ncbi:hypothetical protein ACKA04_04490 [Helcococcus kunzii]|uniref:hypothetical protein n=1 Tax=Helcococcus kunzii TaxID=40091 RepID=UPI0038AB2DFB
MIFINKKTGVKIETNSKLSGVWVEYNPSISDDLKEKNKNELKEEIQKNIEKKEVTQDKKESVKNSKKHKEKEDITVREIKQELDAFGIKYNPKAKKDELYNLMIESR